MTAAELWGRFKKHLCRVDSVGLSLDISRMGFDEGIFALRAAEFERVCKVLSWLLPDAEHRADLRLVKPGPSGPSAGPPGGPT